MELLLRDKVVLITGATGFVGQRLVQALARCGADVTARQHLGMDQQMVRLELQPLQRPPAEQLERAVDVVRTEAELHALASLLSAQAVALYQRLGARMADLGNEAARAAFAAIEAASDGASDEREEQDREPVGAKGNARKRDQEIDQRSLEERLPDGANGHEAGSVLQFARAGGHHVSHP